MSDHQTQLTGPDLSKGIPANSLADGAAVAGHAFGEAVVPVRVGGLRSAPSGARAAQIAHAIEQALRPRGVGVVIEAVHLCMMMRGVEKQNSKTITSALRGQFRECPMTRDEFLRLAHRHE